MLRFYPSIPHSLPSQSRRPIIQAPALTLTLRYRRNIDNHVPRPLVTTNMAHQSHSHTSSRLLPTILFLYTQTRCSEPSLKLRLQQRAQDAAPAVAPSVTADQYHGIRYRMCGPGFRGFCRSRGCVVGCGFLFAFAREEMCGDEVVEAGGAVWDSGDVGEGGEEVCCCRRGRWTFVMRWCREAGVCDEEGTSWLPKP